MDGTQSLRGVDLAYDLRGEGALPLVWGHGLTSSRAAEDDRLLIDWPVLTSSARVMRYDARGHGDSATSEDVSSYQWSEMALDQLMLASLLGIDQYVAGGASLGAATALHAAVTAPQRVAGLVLVIPPTAWETRTAQQELYLQMAAVAEHVGVEPLIEGALALDLPDPLVGRPEIEGRTERRLRAAGASRLATVFRGAANADFPSREQVARLSMPALILAWTGDPGHPVSTAEELAALMPHAVVDIAATWQHYRGWTARVAAFLADLPA